MQQETIKLVNVLRRIARAAGYAAWVKSDPDAVRFCSRQYNKVLARLTEIEPSVKSLFTPLSEDASAEVTRLAARELASYFEDEAPEAQRWRHARRCGSRGARPRAYPFAVRCE
jgi:hypothetical protein